MDVDLSENDLTQCTLTMWRSFYNPIVVMYKRLEHSDDYLELLSQFLLKNTKAFPDIFVPKYNQNNHNFNDLSVQDYQSFTVWLFSRLFHILTQFQLFRLHEIVIDTQLKIMETLKQHYLCGYREISDNYNAILTHLNEYHRNNRKDRLVIKQFVPLVESIPNSDLQLTSIEIIVDNSEKCSLIQTNLIPILFNILNWNLQTSLINDSYFLNIWNNLIYLLENCKFEIKFRLLRKLIQIYRNHWLKIPEILPLKFYLKSLLKVGATLIRNFDEKNQNFTFISKELFNGFFKQYLEFISDFDLIEMNDSFQLIVEVFKRRLQCPSVSKDNDNSDNDVCKLMLKLFHNKNCSKYLLDSYQDSDLKSKFAYQYCEILIKNQMKTLMVHEKSASLIINLSDKNHIWKMIFDRVLDHCAYLKQNSSDNIQSLTVLRTKLSEILYGLQIAQNLQFEFHGTQKFNYFHQNWNELDLLEIAKKFSVYVSNQDTNDILDIMVQIVFKSIFLKHLNSMRVDNLNSLIGFISYPFLNEVNWNLSSRKTHDVVSFLIKQRNSNQSRHVINQLTALEILSCCLLNSDASSDYDVSQKWILNVFKYCSKSTNVDILKKVVELITCLMVSMPNSIDEITTDILHPVINMKCCQCEISAILKLIFCITNSPKFCVCIKNGDKCQFEIKCSICTEDFDNELKFIEIRNNHVRPEINNLLFSCPKLLKSKAPEIRRSVLRLLQSILNHDYHSKLISFPEIVLSFLADTNSDISCEITNFLPRIITNNAEFDDNFHERCMKILVEISKKSLENQDSTAQENVLNLLKNLGISRNIADMSTYFQVILKLFIYFIVLCNSCHSSLAVVYCCDVIRTHHLTEAVVFSQFQKDICKTVIDLTVLNYSMSKTFNLMYSMQKISTTLNYARVREFISNNCQHLLPYLISYVVQRQSELSELLEDFANNSPSNLPDLLNVNFGYIYTHAYLNETGEIFTQCLQFIENTTSNDIETLIRRNSQVIHNELLLNFNMKPEKILFVFDNFLKNQYNFNVNDLNDVRIDRNDVADYLKAILMGVLVFFDSKLVKSNVSDIVKQRILSSLIDIIKLMGKKHVASLRFKVLATLNTSLKLASQQHQKLSLNAWKAFIETCEIADLGPLLSTIIVSLLPLMNIAQNDISAIFNYLLIDNYVHMKAYFSELFFLLDSCVAESFKSIIKKSLQEYEEKHFEEQLKILLKHIVHENIEVRMNSLKFLKKLLSKNRLILNALILGNNGMHSYLIDLLDILTTGCRDNDADLRITYGDCLGELGAIEPSFLPRMYYFFSNEYKSNQGSFSFYIDNDRFISSVLTELTKSLQAETHTLNVNSFALAIQEILKTFDISNLKSSGRYDIWKNSPDSMKEIMLPLLSSKYRVVYDTVDTMSTIHPLYGSNQITTYNKWIYNWMSRMITFMRNTKYVDLLKACQPSFKRDNRITMSFLPLVLIQVLIESDGNDVKMLFEEMMVLLTSFDSPKHESDQVLDQLTFKYTSYSSSGKVNQNFEEICQIKCCKVVFVLLDFLDKWLNEWFFANCPATPDPKTNHHFRSISEFLAQFSHLIIAKCNYFCNEYSRALLYLEKFCETNPNKLVDNLNFFEEIYAQLNEPDGVFGVMCLKKCEPTLRELVIAHEVSGQLQDALLCYEKILQENPMKMEYLKGMIKCYLDLDNPLMAYNLIEGRLKLNPELFQMLNDLEAETLWRLSKFEELTDFYDKPDIKLNGWSTSIGKLLINFNKNNRNEFRNHLEFVRGYLVDELSMASIEDSAYQFGYPQILRLHVVNEIDKIEDLLSRLMNTKKNIKICEEQLTEFEKELNLRLDFVQPTLRSIEPILCLRRIVLSQFANLLKEHISPIITNKINRIIGKSWLKSAEIARQNGLFHQAYAYILSSEKYHLKELFVEKAQLLWMKNDKDDAIKVLKRGLEEDFDMSFAESQKLVAKARLLYAIYNDETANVDIDVNLSYYKSSVEAYKEWESSLVHLAQYYDKFYDTVKNEEKEAKGPDIRIHAMNSYGKSLCYGSKYLYQSMPRMLSIWLDYGKNKTVKKNETLRQMCLIMKNFATRLPAFMFLTAFSQLASRICHQDVEVFQTLKAIIVMLILKYPHQTLWMFLAIMKSTYNVRIKRAQEILMDSSIKKNQTISKFILDFNKFADKLIELCNKKISSGVQNVSLRDNVPALIKLLSDKNVPPIMIPIKKCMKIIMPTTESISNNYNPFSDDLIFISGIDNEIQVINSLQRPRKITLRGSDGNNYITLLKPKDDLRKDCRMMDVNDVVSQYLHRDPDSRQRRLHIKTYSVVPLNDECGLIEWILNLVSFRSIILNIYGKKGICVSSKIVNKFSLPVTANIEDKKRVFLDKLLPLHPPVFSNWFRYMFSDPHSWFQARNAYIRTTAVMSMVGYMLGLGDRHGENILFDAKTGDTIHVDFNCIFNRGELLEYPEKVPFRLTHNMVKAMGPLGVEGTFRKACIITLRVLRTNSDILMSIVEPFVYDPLVSWQATKEGYSRPNTTHIELTNEQSLEYLKNVKLRLDGMMKSSKGKTSSISLSPEGQVNYLIEEATSIDNLCQMYIGWGAYL